MNKTRWLLLLVFYLMLSASLLAPNHLALATISQQQLLTPEEQRVQMQAVQAAISILLLDENEDEIKIFLPMVHR